MITQKPITKLDHNLGARAIIEVSDEFGMTNEYWLWADGLVTIDDSENNTLYTTLSELQELINHLTLINGTAT